MQSAVWMSGRCSVCVLYLMRNSMPFLVLHFILCLCLQCGGSEAVNNAPYITVLLDITADHNFNTKETTCLIYFDIYALEARFQNMKKKKTTYIIYLLSLHHILRMFVMNYISDTIRCSP
jgi:hypothetical protein